MKYLIGALILIVIIIVAGVIFIYSGTYNFSTLEHHNKLTLWIINTTFDHSLDKHAEEVKGTPPNDTASIREGAVAYSQSCEGCHGAPGINNDMAQKSFYPEPPYLVETVKDFSPQQLFWMVKNGVKMSGMPAFGAALSDTAMWKVVAFTSRLPITSKEQYMKLTERDSLPK